MFASILGFAPMLLNFALSVAGRFLSPKNTRYAGHAASLIVQGLTLAERIREAHESGRDITDAEIAAATDAAVKAADQFGRVLAELQDRP